MKKIALIIVGVIGLIVIILGISLIAGYNKLVDVNEQVDMQYSEIDRRLQQRYDTLTQLATAVNGFQAHEQTIFEMITSARAAYAAAKASGDIEGMIQADSLQSLALTDLLALFEDNEPLQTTEAYGDYMDAVWGIESALSEARRQYNLSVQEYNLYVRKFPGVLYASLFNYVNQKTYWKVGENATDIPDITFGG